MGLYEYWRSMCLPWLYALWLIPALLVAQALFTPCQAQITLDGSLGAMRPLQGPHYVIPADVGQIRGQNLFHSFAAFNIRTNEGATFTGPDSIENILSRVTGGQQSFIDGYLRSEMPRANLFLLNPSGVLFGANAALDVQGSFHVSTADEIRLADGAVFSAHLSATSVLSFESPVAFGFLGAQAPAKITIQGSTLSVRSEQTLSLVGGDVEMVGDPALSSPEHPSLGAPGGQVYLTSRASAGEVRLMPAYQTAALEESLASLNDQFGTVTLRQGAVISTQGARGGDVTIAGGRLTLMAGSAIISRTAGAGSGGTVRVVATEAVELTGSGPVFPSRILAGTDGDGPGGRVEIATPQLILADTAQIATATNGTMDAGVIELRVGRLSLSGGAEIDTTTLGSGNGGTVRVVATDRVDLVGGRVDTSGSFLPSRLSNQAFGSGHAGRIEVQAPVMMLQDGAEISAETIAEGNGGEIALQVGRLSITEGARITSTADIIFNPETGGRSGNVTLEVQRLTLTAGGAIESNTNSAQAGGTVRVVATEAVELTGSRSHLSSRILAGTDGDGPGGRVEIDAPQLILADTAQIATVTNGTQDAGVIELRVDRLSVSGGAEIDTTTIGSGNGGTVHVMATDRVDITGGRVDASGSFLPSHLASQAQGIGDAGRVEVQAPVIMLQGGAEISAETIAEGNGGEITLLGGNVTITDGARITSTANVIFGPETGGRSGNVTLGVQRLTLTAGGAIESSTNSAQPGGTVQVMATEAVELSGSGPRRDPEGQVIQVASRIQAGTSGTGAGGSIEITAPRVILRTGSRMTVQSTGSTSGPAGNITLMVGERLDSLDGAVTTEAEAADGGNIVLQAPTALVQLVDSALTAQARGQEAGRSNGGNVTIRAQAVALNRSRVLANAFGGDGGNIRIEASGVVLADAETCATGTCLNASSELGVDGTVEVSAPVTNISGILAPLSQSFSDDALQLGGQCEARIREGKVSSFIVAKRDGVPLEPGDIRLAPLWQGTSTGAVPPVITPLEHHTQSQTAGTLYLAGHAQWQHQEPLTSVVFDVTCTR